MTARVAVVAGAIFVVSGLLKFVAFHGEVDAFERFGMPLPEVSVVAVGVVETVGGLLLLARRLIAPAAAVLAATMAGAFTIGGIGAGDVIPSLTLAPALLVAMLYLLARTARKPAQPGGRPEHPSSKP